MITSLQFINFRSHQDTRIQLHPINLLIGPVASGKSNIFKGLVLIQNSVHRTLIELFPPGLGEFQWVRSRWASPTDPVGFEVEIEGLSSFPTSRARYILQIAPSPAGLYVLEETLTRQDGDDPWQYVFQRRGKSQLMGAFGEVDPYQPTLLHKVWHQDPEVNAAAEGPRFARDVARALSSFGYYHLEVSRLKSRGTAQFWDRINYYGDRLPDFLAWAKSTKDGVPVYQSILHEMRQLMPDIESILVTQVNPDEQGFGIEFRGHQGYIAAPDLSDGTLYTLGLLCIIYSPKRPSILCIEEPETGLHPGRLRWLFDRMLSLAYPENEAPPVQLLLSTHSPYLVDFFREMQRSVHLVERCDGRSRIRDLEEVQHQLQLVPGTDEPIGQQWATGLFEGV